jgi:hypothetical protein
MHLVHAQANSCVPPLTSASNAPSDSSASACSSRSFSCSFCRSVGTGEATEVMLKSHNVTKLRNSAHCAHHIAWFCRPSCLPFLSSNSLNRFHVRPVSTKLRPLKALCIVDLSAMAHTSPRCASLSSKLHSSLAVATTLFFAENTRVAHVAGSQAKAHSCSPL